MPQVRTTRTKKNTGPIRFAIYLRCSTDDQKHGDFTTIDVQREKNTAYVEAQGGVVIGVYADEGKSGTNLNRPEWKRLLSDAQAGKFDAVVMTYMSRLARGEAYHVAEYLLKESGVQIALVQEHFTPDLAGHVNKQMTILMDGMYPKMVSQWTKTKMQQMVERGFVCGGIVPFGMSREFVTDAVGFASADKEPPKRNVPHPEESVFVRRAFEIFVETRNISRVIEYLSAMSGRRFTYDSAKLLLTNEVYRGVLRFGEWVNFTSHEAIVSEALWDMAQEAMQNRTRRIKRDPLDTASYYLRGIVYCPACGCRMTPGNHHGRTAAVRYYECTGAHKKSTVGCPVRRVNAHSLHNVVYAEICRAAEHPTRMTQLVRDAVKALPAPEKLDDQLVAVSRRLRDVEKRTKNCLTVIETGGAAARAVLARLDELEQEKIGLQEERNKIAGQIADTRINRPDVEQVQSLWQRFAELWEKGTEDDRAELMPLLVERVEMIGKEHGIARLVFDAKIGAKMKNPTSYNVGLTSGLGAGDGLEPPTFGL